MVLLKINVCINCHKASSKCFFQSVRWSLCSESGFDAEKNIG